MIAYRVSQIFTRVSLRLYHTFAELQDKQKVKKTQQQMTFDRERAVLACQIIEIIKNSKRDIQTTIYEPSLRQQIFKIQIPSFTTSEESRQSIFKIFKQGIPIDQTVFNQATIQLAKENKIFFESIMNSANVAQENTQSYNPFIFCPNRLVTPCMFENLLITRRYNILIQGGYGIGKTVSIMLLHMLSSIVNNYAYRAFCNPQEKIKFISLKNRKLLFDVPKLFYWSVQINEQAYLQNQKNFIKILLNQATQLQKDQQLLEELKKIQSLGLLAVRLKQTYQKNEIKTKVIIDQLNITASLMRKWNFFFDKYYLKEQNYIHQIEKQKRKLSLAKLQKQKQQIEQKVKLKQQQYNKWVTDNRKNMEQNQKKQYQPATRLRQIYKSISLIGHNVLYNSSMNIEKNLLSQSKHDDIRHLTLELFDHKQLVQVKVPFSKGLSQPLGFNEFKQYFWFQVEKKLVAKGFVYERLQEFKKIFYNQFQAKKIKKHFNIQHIRQSFYKKPNLFDINSTDLEISVAQKFKERINNFHTYCRTSSIEKLRIFMQNGSLPQQQKKLKFMRILYYLAMQKMQSEKSQDRNMIFRISQLDHLLDPKQPGLANLFLRSTENNNQLFQLQFCENDEEVDLLWEPQQFLQFFWAIVLEKQERTKDLTQSQINLFAKLNKSLGSAIKNSLIQVLIKPYTQISFMQKSEKQQFKIQKNLYFLNFNNKGSKIWVNFSPLFKQALIHKGKQILGLPSKIGQRQGGQPYAYFSQDNAQIDFVIIKYIEKYKQFVINAFDVIIVTNIQAIKQKIIHTIEFYKEKMQGQTNLSQFSQNQREIFNLTQDLQLNNNFMVIHTIVCNKQVGRLKLQNIFSEKDLLKHNLKGGKLKSLRVHFVLSSLEDITVDYCQDKNVLNDFYDHLNLYQTIIKKGFPLKRDRNDKQNSS